MPADAHAPALPCPSPSSAPPAGAQAPALPTPSSYSVTPVPSLLWCGGALELGMLTGDVGAFPRGDALAPSSWRWRASHARHGRQRRRATNFPPPCSGRHEGPGAVAARDLHLD
ncbi:uncharacterized protein LOC119356102 isoform X1 [Triticum dicoccoides]|uniref:uncharacterized protein LOC119356102 isoform X1 n=1 Tax=Triticum dicoccoides TaxID=85692 RepID=UPI00188E3659|nr:uncharacterized protein LOC119356102 isoform X1 [Triticum dicoccoides]